jgi:hypothetical protein
MYVKELLYDGMGWTQMSHDKSCEEVNVLSGSAKENSLFTR